MSKRSPQPPRGAILVWVLPALAVLAAATIWWLTPEGLQPNRQPVYPSSASPSPSTLIPAEASPKPLKSGAPKSGAPKSGAPKSGVQRPSNSAHSRQQVPGQPTTSTGGGSKTEPPKGGPQRGEPQINKLQARQSASPSTTDQQSRPAQVVLTSGERDILNQSSEEIAQGLEGEWSGFYQGQREMTVAAGGTGKMVSYPEGLAASLLAAKLTFDFRWKLNGDQLEFETVGGEPADKVKIVTRMYGRKRSHRILKRSSDELELLDEDGVTKYLWKRATRKSATQAPQAM